MYITKITEIGEMVPLFEAENLLVLFGPMATNELKPICAIHDMLQPAPVDLLCVGGIFSIGSQKYEILEVGNQANKNFHELGHISIYFSEIGEGPVLPGAIRATPIVFPTVEVGSEIVFY